MILPEEKYNSTNFLTLWNFEGIFKYSPIFYGWYSKRDKSKTGYRLPFAYFMTGLVVYGYSFFAILRKMAENSRMSKLSEKEDECVFSWKLFTGWDYMIGNAETAHNRVASIVMGFKEALLEEAEKRKQPRQWKVIGKRILVNIAITGLLTLSAYVVVKVVERSKNKKQTSFWQQNETTIVMNLITFIFPTLFEVCGIFEGYHPRKQLRLQLARIMLMNLLNLYSLIVALFYRINDMTEELAEYQRNHSLSANKSLRDFGQTTQIPETVVSIANACYNNCVIPSIDQVLAVSSFSALLILFNSTFRVPRELSRESIQEVLNLNFSDTSTINAQSVTETTTEILYYNTSTALSTVGYTEYNNETALPENYTLLENITLPYEKLKEDEIEEGVWDFEQLIWQFLEYINGNLSNITASEYMWNSTNSSALLNFSTIEPDLNFTEVTEVSSTEISTSTYEQLKTTIQTFVTTHTPENTSLDSFDNVTLELYQELYNFLQTIPKEVWSDTFLNCTTICPSSEAKVTADTEERLSERLETMDYPNRRRLSNLCWETMFGQELVKLTIMDLIFTIAQTLSFDFLRGIFVRVMNNCWCWDLEKKFPQYGDFKVAENILHLVNNQGMVWMGMFFTPGLVVMNLIKLYVLMYLRSWSVLTCNVPHEVIFRASRSNNFYYALLLMMLFLCVLPVGFAIVWVKPSWHCGPFSDYSRIFHIFTKTITANLPPPLNMALAYIASPGIVIPLLVLLILIIYYLVSLTGALREANNDLKIQLRRERTEERRKMFQIAERRRIGSSGSGELTNPSFAKWKKLLHETPSGKSLDDTPQEESQNAEPEITAPDKRNSSKNKGKRLRYASCKQE